MTREKLGDAGFATAFQAGRDLPMADVVALAHDLALAVELGGSAPGSTSHAPAPGQTNEFGLTAREMEVLPFLAAGLSDREIGEALSISPRTVARHLHSVYQKFGVGSRAAATALAHRHGLI
jgi:DNA-binding CsgD family transcriptional regulator